MGLQLGCAFGCQENNWINWIFVFICRVTIIITSTTFSLLPFSFLLRCCSCTPVPPPLSPIWLHPSIPSVTRNRTHPIYPSTHRPFHRHKKQKCPCSHCPRTKSIGSTPRGSSYVTQHPPPQIVLDTRYKWALWDLPPASYHCFFFFFLMLLCKIARPTKRA